MKATEVELRDQLLRLISCATSVLIRVPPWPTLSDGGTAKEWLRTEIERAKGMLDKQRSA